MSIQLTSSDYYNLVWDIFSQTKIDKVSGEVILNQTSAESERIQTLRSADATYAWNDQTSSVNLKTENVLGNGIPDSLYFGQFLYASNLVGSWWTDTKFGRGLLYARGSFTKVIDIPVEGSLAVEMEYSGKRYQAGTEDLSWESFPSDEQFKDATSLDVFIKNLNITPTEGQFPVRDLNEYPSGGLVFGSGGVIRVGSENFLKMGSDYPFNESAPFITPYATITPTETEREYRVDWLAVVRETFMLAKRKGDVLGNPKELDYGDVYAEVVDELVFTVSGSPYSTEKITFSYPLNGTGSYPFSISSNELMTVSSTLNNSPWSEEISRLLVDKYSQGKFTARARVTAQWILENNVHINSMVEITNLRGVKINRKGVATVFQVKNIEKNYSDGAFTFDIKLLEV